MIINYEFKYRSRGKWFFVPNDKCERRGRRMLAYFKRRVVFPDYMYHFKNGGHVAALHAHLNNSLFFKIDIQNFYYSIARMRVTRALRHWGYPGANTFAVWSCVRNPLPGPPHALPIGFVQSSLLASLALMKSEVADAIDRAVAKGVCISVYLDDFIGSHNDLAVLTAAYEDIRHTCVAAGFIPNPGKLVPPQAAVTAFNCDLTNGTAEVNAARVAKYFSRTDRTVLSDAGFDEYRDLVRSQNV
ncbi:reverse transcriptase domain-containing protein [Bradyrhizobium elkanii]|uniref:reverse transcriptase domain-containing protein n=1 Tax=Bradyrhizobium elkanii TaxID=29448 RepID=UPI002711F1E9|nr:reverse transcriptase domain-containing protein [Bradyrhizobium elkanii]WLA38528.1 reverse transcriptase domain-containing protein [Bradyrhizobium elkanii]